MTNSFKLVFMAIILNSSISIAQTCNCGSVLQKGVFNYFEAKYKFNDYHKIHKEIFSVDHDKPLDKEQDCYFVFDVSYTKSQIALLQKITSGSTLLSEEEKNELMASAHIMLCADSREAYSICKELCVE